MLKCRQPVDGPRIRTLPERVRSVMIGRDQFGQLRQPAGDHVEHRLGAIQRDFLCQYGDPPAGKHPDRAVIGGLLTADHAQQRGFARAIASHQAHAFALAQFKVHGLQQGTVPKGQGYLVESQNGHCCSRIREFLGCWHRRQAHTPRVL